MTRFQRLLVVAGLIAAGVTIGAALPPMDAARAEMQPETPPQAFQSGAQQSVPILREIAATLKQMDARLARIETAAKQYQPARTSAAKQ
jgi:hypothetical protein